MEETVRYRYPGISSFEKEDADIFFGREDDRVKLADLIETERLVLLYSRSGLGKTSLLKAALIPELTQRGYHPFYIRHGLYHEGILTPVQTVIRKTVLQDQKLLPDTFLQKFLVRTHSLWYAFKAWQISRQTDEQNLEKPFVLIFDQFEEIGSYPEKQLNDFKRQLAEILASTIPNEYQLALKNDKLLSEPLTDKELDMLYRPFRIKVVFAFRSDQMSVLNRMSDYFPNILTVYYELKPLTSKLAEKAITEPAKKQGRFRTPTFEYENAAVEKIMAALQSEKNNEVDTAHLQILLQHVEKELVEKNKQQVVTPAILGDLNQVYKDYYDNCLDKLQAEREHAQELIEDKLIIDKRRISLDKVVCLKEVSESTLVTLVETRLLRAEPNAMGSISYEVSHDSLVKPILEAREARMVKEKEKELNKALEVEKRKQKRQGWVLIGITVAFIASMALLVWAFKAQETAERERNKANKNAEELEIAKQQIEQKNNENKKLLNELLNAEIVREKQVINQKERDIRFFNSTLPNNKALLHAVRQRDSLNRRVDTLTKKLKEN